MCKNWRRLLVDHLTRQNEGYLGREKEPAHEGPQSAFSGTLCVNCYD